MVEITDEKSAEAWLETQTHQAQVWFAARCALRALPAIGNWIDADTSDLVFKSVAATFIAAAAASCARTEMKALEASAKAFGESAENAGLSGRNAVPHAAFRTAAIAAMTAGSTAIARGFCVRYAAAAASRSARVCKDVGSEAAVALSAASMDTEHVKEWRALWPLSAQPKELDKGWEALKQQWQDTPNDWSFWIEWYEAILNGTPLPWVLTQRIALEVTPEEWDAGPGVVAARIREIRAELSGNSGGEPRQRAFEPASVGIMFTYKEITQASVQSVAVDISSAVERFLSESGANAPPDQFLPLADMPGSLNRIGELLSLARTSGTEQALKEEVGRLNEKIARLEGELQKLRDAPEPVFAPALKAQIARSLGDWKLYAALCAGVWVVSGDDTGVRERCARLLACREINFGDDSPMPKPSEMLPPVTSVEV